MKTQIVILGQPIVKKNSQQVVWTSGRPIKISSKAYTEWHKDALEQLETLGFNPEFKKAKKSDRSLKALIGYPVNLQCRFFMRDKRRVDLSNLYESADILVEVGVLEDDNYLIVSSHDGSGVFVDPSNPRTEWTITPK